MVKEYKIMKKKISKYISEKLRITKASIKNIEKTIVVEDFKHLNRIIEREIKKNGVHCSLNHIDISNIEDISYCFYNYNIREFDGDISEWDVSNVTDMTAMFLQSKFTGKYGDISDWDVSNVLNMKWMFARTNYFNTDISKWKINRKCVMDSMFLDSSLDKKYRPQKV